MDKAESFQRRPDPTPAYQVSQGSPTVPNSPDMPRDTHLKDDARNNHLSQHLPTKKRFRFSTSYISFSQLHIHLYSQPFGFSLTKSYICCISAFHSQFYSIVVPTCCLQCLMRVDFSVPGRMSMIWFTSYLKVTVTITYTKNIVCNSTIFKIVFFK